MAVDAVGTLSVSPGPARAAARHAGDGDGAGVHMRRTRAGGRRLGRGAAHVGPHLRPRPPHPHRARRQGSSPVGLQARDLGLPHRSCEA